MGGTKPIFSVGNHFLKQKMLRTPPILAAFLVALMSLGPVAQVHATTQTITFNKTATFDNVTVTANGSLTIDTTAKTITGTIMVKVVNDTSGQTIFQKTFMINFNFGSMGTTGLVLMIPAIPLLLAASCNVNVSADTAMCVVSKSPDVANQGMVNIVDVASIAANFGTTNAKYDLDSDGVVGITDVAIVAADFGAPIFW